MKKKNKKVWKAFFGSTREQQRKSIAILHQAAAEPPASFSGWGHAVQDLPPGQPNLFVEFVESFVDRLREADARSNPVTIDWDHAARAFGSHSRFQPDFRLASGWQGDSEAMLNALRSDDPHVVTTFGYGAEAMPAAHPETDVVIAQMRQAGITRLEQMNWDIVMGGGLPSGLDMFDKEAADHPDYYARRVKKWIIEERHDYLKSYINKNTICIEWGGGSGHDALRLSELGVKPALRFNFDRAVEALHTYTQTAGRDGCPTLSGQAEFYDPRLFKDPFWKDLYAFAERAGLGIADIEIGLTPYNVPPAKRIAFFKARADLARAYPRVAHNFFIERDHTSREKGTEGRQRIEDSYKGFKAFSVRSVIAGLSASKERASLTNMDQMSFRRRISETKRGIITSLVMGDQQIVAEDGTVLHSFEPGTDVRVTMSQRLTREEARLEDEAAGWMQVGHNELDYEPGRDLGIDQTWAHLRPKYVAPAA